MIDDRDGWWERGEIREMLSVWLDDDNDDTCYTRVIQ